MIVCNNKFFCEIIADFVQMINIIKLNVNKKYVVDITVKFTKNV